MKVNKRQIADILKLRFQQSTVGSPEGAQLSRAKVGRTYEFSTAAVISWRTAQAVADAVSKAGGKIGPSLESLRRDKEELVVRAKSLDLRNWEWELVPREKVLRLMRSNVRASYVMGCWRFRTDSSILAAETDADRVHGLLKPEDPQGADRSCHRSAEARKDA